MKINGFDGFSGFCPNFAHCSDLLRRQAAVSSGRTPEGSFLMRINTFATVYGIAKSKNKLRKTLRTVPLSSTICIPVHSDLMKIPEIFDIQQVLHNLIFNFAMSLGLAGLFVIIRNGLPSVLPEEIRSLGLARSPEWVGAR